jgi:uncharacterized protein YbjT (DUF2867 family)
MEVYAGVNKSARMASAYEDMLKNMSNVHCVSVETTDEKAIAEQLRDVEELFLIPSATAEDKVQGAKAYIDAAKRAGVKYILLLSVLHPDAPGYDWGRQFYSIERYLHESGIPWTVLRCNFYTQYLTLFCGPVSKGSLPLPIGDGRFSPVDVADVAAIARHILRDPSSFRYSTYDLTGPKSVSGQEIADALSRTLGHPVKFQDVSIDEAMRCLAENNIPEHETRGFRQFFELTKKNSQFDLTSTFYFKNFMNRNPHSLEETFRLNKSTWEGECPSGTCTMSSTASS